MKNELTVVTILFFMSLAISFALIIYMSSNDLGYWQLLIVPLHMLMTIAIVKAHKKMIIKQTDNKEDEKKRTMDV